MLFRGWVPYGGAWHGPTLSPAAHGVVAHQCEDSQSPGRGTYDLDASNSALRMESILW